MDQDGSDHSHYSSEDDIPLSELPSNNARREVYVSKNGTRWSKTCPPETQV